MCWTSQFESGVDNDPSPQLSFVEMIKLHSNTRWVRDRVALPARVISVGLCLAMLASCGGGGGGGAGAIGSSSSPAPVTYALSGRVQKGPFATGSQVSVNELNAGLNPTGITYSLQTSDALGNFALSTPTGSRQVEIVAQGFYLDELTGQLSAAPITLRALVDLASNAAPTVNALTTLQSPRLKVLVSQGSTFATAEAQSLREVLGLFGIDASRIVSLGTSSAMRIDGATDGDAVLLATSAILLQMAADAARANGTAAPAEFSNLVNALAAQLAGGAANPGASFLAARNVAQTALDAAAVAANLQSYYARNGLTVVAPKLAEWLDRSNSGVLPQRLVTVTGLTFAALAGAVPGQVVTSAPVTIAGAGSGVAVPVVASAGAAIVKNGVALPGALTSAQNGDILALRVMAPGYGLTVSPTLTVGTSTARWDVVSRQLGGTISGLSSNGLSLQINGSTLAVPAGSTGFTYSGTLAVGAGFSVMVQAQPKPPLQICSVSNGTGTVGAAAGAITVTCGGITQLALWADSSANGVTVFAVDPVGGGLTAVPGSPFAAGQGAMDVAVTPDHRFAYVVNQSSNNISAYSINPVTGALSSIAGAPFSTGYIPSGIAIDPAGRFAYVAYGIQSVSQPPSAVAAYSIDAATGALTPLAGSPFLTAPHPYSIVFNPVTPFAYVSSANGVRGHSQNPTTGALTPISNGSLSGTALPVPAIAFDPSGRFAFVPSMWDGYVAAYAVDANTGLFTPAPGVNRAPGAAVAVHPGGRIAYLGGYSVAGAAGFPSTFAIDSTSGALTAVGGVSIGRPLAVDRNARFVYAGDTGGIMVYPLDSAGVAQAAIPGSPFASGASTGSFVLVPVP